jgi:hypothetical protein
MTVTRGALGKLMSREIGGSSSISGRRFGTPKQYTIDFLKLLKITNQIQFKQFETMFLIIAAPFEFK